MTGSAVVVGKLAALAGAAVGVDVVAGGGPKAAGELLQQASATVGALVVLAGAVWWLVGPRVKEWTRSQSAAATTAAEASTTAAEAIPRAAAQLGEVRRELEGVVARLDDVEGSTAALHAQLEHHLAHAYAETRLVSELILRAADVETPDRTRRG